LVRLEHKAGPTIIRELALRLYPSPLESFREAISNAFDEGSHKVEVTCSSREVIVEDWGEGIKEVETFRIYGQDTKAGLGGEIIGEKGLGKLALLRLGVNVEFRTNNGKFGIDIFMRVEYIDAEHGALDDFLDHKGTRVIVPDPDLVPPTDELADYLRKVFGLRIASGLDVILNGAKLTSKVDPKEERLFRMKGGTDIFGNLKADKSGKGYVDLYVKHVFIKSVLVDPERDFKGWVNSNELVPTTNRNDILSNITYVDFLDHLREEVAHRFPRREEELDKLDTLLANELTRMMRSYLKHMGITPRGDMPSGKGNEPYELGRQKREVTHRKTEKPRKPEPEEEKRLKAFMKTDKPILRTRRLEFGFDEVRTPLGNDKPPMYFNPPNLVIHNTSNDLYRFAKKNKASMGPKWLRILPWLARTCVCMNKDSSKWDMERMNLETDKAMRYFLAQKGEITD